MTTQETKEAVVRGTARWALVATAALLQVACCDDEPLDPGTAGCQFDQAAVTETTVAVLEITGGTTGANDEYVIRDDGTIKHVDRLTGAMQERTVPGGADRAAQLVGDLAASRVGDEEQGCYLTESDSANPLIVRVTLQSDGLVQFFGNECASGPHELVAAIDLLESYVNEAR